MTGPIEPDLAAWVVLCRAQWEEAVTLDPVDGTLYDQGRRLPAQLTPHVHALAEYGYVRLDDPVSGACSRRHVRLTRAGEFLLDLLNDLRRCWMARRRAGLPCCHSDLDTLTLMLDANTVHFGHR